MSKGPEPAPNAAGEFLLFQTENAQTRVQVRLMDGVLWLTQRQMAELYEKDVRTVSEHLKNVYADGELNPDATVRKFRIVAREGARDIERLVDHYNLDAVLHVGYDARAESSKRFFATIQNKLHWATHGHTAAELIALRADAGQPHMGLMTWAAAPQGGAPRKADVSVAKNYLNEDELVVLNRIVTAYLEFAELQALDRKPMTMADWIAKLDGFLRLSGREILTHAGRMTAEAAQGKAEAAFEVYRQQQLVVPSRAEQAFEAALARPVKALETQRKATPRPKAGKNKKGEA